MVPLAQTALALLAAVAPADPPERELLIVGSNIESHSPVNMADVVAIRGERIVSATTRANAERKLAKDVEVLDLKDHLVMPGFFDSHCHLMAGGIELAELDLRGCRDTGELAERVRAYAESLPAGAWVRGRGFDQSLFPNGEWPTRDLLDPVSGERPAYLRRVDGHSVLVNTRALQLAGIDAETPDPSNGVIDRDARGEPTGILKEGAVDLVAGLLPPRTFAEKLAGARLALREAAVAGITTCVDHGGDPEVYLELLRRGELTARIELWFDLTDDLGPALEWRDKLAPHRDWIRLGTLKGYVDGTFGSRTAALHAPFADDPSTSGVLLTDPKALTARVIAADRAGFSVALHAIGDRAVAIALDAFAAAAKENGTTGLRHRVEHVQVLAEGDADRFAELGVIASVQPCHLLTDRRFAEQRLGAERIGRSYPYQTLLDAGATLAFGSDFPVEPLDPRRNLYAAVARGDEADPAAPAFVPAEAIPLEEALWAATGAGAFASHRETAQGMLRAGMLADLVVFERSFSGADPRAMLANRVLLTIVGGRIVYRAE